LIVVTGYLVLTNQHNSNFKKGIEPD